MSATRVSKLTMQLVAVGTLVAMSAGVASAQKVKAAGPPVTTHGQIKANEAAVNRCRGTACGVRRDPCAHAATSRRRAPSTRATGG